MTKEKTYLSPGVYLFLVYIYVLVYNPLLFKYYFRFQNIE